MKKIPSKDFFRNNGLSIVIFTLFFIFIIGQSIAGYYHELEEKILHHHQESSLTYGQYLASGAFVESVFENWESEFLQMGLYVLLTAFLFQKGSAESKSMNKKNEVDRAPEKSIGKSGVPWPVRKGGLALHFYKHSLTTALLLIFAISFLLHAAGGVVEYREELLEHGREIQMSMWGYMTTSRFWFESFQNWQSEFLSIGAVVILSIFLRQQGSPESKPVDAPHSEEEAS